MKRKVFITLAMALVVAMMLSACGKKPTVESPTPSAEPTSSPEAPSPSNNQYPLIVKAGSNVTVDLNGDGKDDEVNFAPTEDSSAILHLSVNGTDFSKSVYNQNLYTDHLDSAYYCITDIDSSDNLLEIAMMDYGPSDDCVTDFFRYDGTDLKYIGQVSGLIISANSDKSDLTFNGDGTITSYIRLSVLQTWWAKADWKLSNSGGFEVVPQDLFYPNSDAGCSVSPLVDITVYEKNSSTSTKSVLSSGTGLTIVATDNKEWVLAETSDKKQCWIHLDSEDGQSIETANGYDYASNVLSGLCFAD